MIFQRLVLTVLIFWEGDAPAFHFLEQGIGTFGHDVAGTGVHHARRHGAHGFQIKFRRGLSGNGHYVQRVHAAGNGAAVHDVAFFKDGDVEIGIQLQGMHGRDAAGAAAADDEEIRFHGLQFHRNVLAYEVAGSGLFLFAEAVTHDVQKNDGHREQQKCAGDGSVEKDRPVSAGNEQALAHLVLKQRP